MLRKAHRWAPRRKTVHIFLPEPAVVELAKNDPSALGTKVDCNMTAHYVADL